MVVKVNRTKLELLQIERGWTGAQLAEAAGISRQTLSTVKTRQTCRLATLLKLTAALGTVPENVMEVSL